MIQLGRADGSAGRSAALINTGTWFCVTYDEQSQADIWGRQPRRQGLRNHLPGDDQEGGRNRFIGRGGYLLAGEYPYRENVHGLGRDN